MANPSDLPSNPPRNTPELEARRGDAAPGNETAGSDRAGTGGVTDDSAGSPGGTLGTGGTNRDEDG